MATKLSGGVEVLMNHRGTIEKNDRKSITSYHQSKLANKSVTYTAKILFIILLVQKNQKRLERAIFLFSFEIYSPGHEVKTLDYKINVEIFSLHIHRFLTFLSGYKP